MARKTGWLGSRGRRRCRGWLAQRYGRAQLPAIYALMDAYTVCDKYFTDFAGNSFPNHAFAIGADAEWAYTNPSASSGYNPILQTPGVPVRLEDAGKSWANYGNGFAFRQHADPRMQANVRQTFVADASWVYPPAHQDFHPAPLLSVDGSSMARSDSWLKSAVQAVAQGPDWGRVVLFITFDDWGGWADHVDPPEVETFPSGGIYSGEPYRFGSRVPCIVVGPYAKPHYVSHVRSSHVSLVAFIERLRGLPPSPNLDAARRTTAPSEQALQDCVDVNQPPLPPPAFP